jgi:hypothetical protein
VVEALVKGKLTGWEVIPAELMRSETAGSVPYCVLVATGRCGKIDNSRSVQMHKRVIGNPKGGTVWRGLYFDESTWDGSDLFCPQGAAFFFVTNRFKEVLEAIPVGNIQLQALSDIERASLV